jgi:hypothetical protein
VIERVTWRVPDQEQKSALFTNTEIIGDFFHGTECNERGIMHRTDTCSGHEETVIHVKRIISREPVEPVTDSPSPGV